MPIAFQIKSDDADDDSPEDFALFGTGQFSGVKSAYILKKVKSTPFEKRNYIYNLIALYRYITKGITSMNASRGYGMLAMEHPEEHLELLKENAPDRYKEFLKQHKKDLSRERKENEKRNQTIGQQRKEWIAAGGKV
jgi:hypothetical protein